MVIDYPRIPTNCIGLFEALDVGVFITDQNFIIIAINSVFENLTTISRQELIGQNVQYLLDKGYISESICHVVAKQHKTETGILHYKKAERDIVVTGKPVFGDEGDLQYIVCTLRDVNLLANLYKELQAAKNESECYKEKLKALTIPHFEDDEYIAKDPKTKRMLQLAVRIAKGDSTVLILGESGAGKDLLAKFIHKYSARSKGAFVHINCGAIPESLFEAEFFGYSSGAFTGASKTGKAGLLEVADNGILFLDEIAELPIFMQAKLLKVLQDRTITRVGDTMEKKIDIKVIAATNRKLEKLVANGQFREDLYYRLNVFQITIPSLRERKDDIPSLISLFLKKFNKKHNQQKTIKAEVIEALMTYHWPGNVRELEHMMERLVVLCPNDVIKAEDLPEILTENFLMAEAVKLSDTLSLKTIVERLERAVILNSINKTETLQDAAKQLGVDVSTLTRKKQKHGIFKRSISIL